MIIGNNNPNNNFQNQVRTNTNNQNNNFGNNFENRWNQVQEYNQNRTQKNIFTADIKQRHYADATNTSDMHDRTLAMLNERLQQGTISSEEFKRQCEILGRQRQSMNKNNKLF